MNKPTTIYVAETRNKMLFHRIRDQNWKDSESTDSEYEDRQSEPAPTFVSHQVLQFDSNFEKI